MRRVLFIIAFVILANPLLSNIDIVPDFLAYILIMIALSKSTYIEAKANGAFKGARNMLIVSIGRLAATYFTVMSIDDVLSLVFSFVFFILEMVLGVSFLLKLFDYLSVLICICDDSYNDKKIRDGFVPSLLHLLFEFY